ncbi:Pentatricopeptide repeat-containing protein [Seminavis robusta]|uniref:Pentatricopeptide repeat-containing protein n=1 Tax=Seminavis robusta TaxID=568900 RepID=A0A9N8DZ66_9STRA|nr:Pentatricopeptide repeat-containing protein [Seminavis robusta]|eukprot:Sro468_g149130.1 Pentatricopeptide repeat-containing protein (934) ;mRNA; f:27583-30384
MRKLMLGVAILGLTARHPKSASSIVQAFQPLTTRQPTKVDRQSRLAVAALDKESTSSTSSTPSATAQNNNKKGNKNAKQGRNHPKPRSTKPIKNDKSTPTNTTNNKNGGGKKEFRWLYWLYKQWHRCPVGTVEKSILQQFLPAAQSWRNKRSIVGAQRATQLVERYASEYLAGNPHAQLHHDASSSGNYYFARLLRAALDAWIHIPLEKQQQLSGDGSIASVVSMQQTTTTTTHKAHQLLDKLTILADNAMNTGSDTTGSTETMARVQSLQRQIHDHRIWVQEQILDKTMSANNNTTTTSSLQDNNNNIQEITELLHKSMSFAQGPPGTTTTRQLEDSLVAMQQLIVTLQRTFSDHNNNNNSQDDLTTSSMIDAYERELVFTTPEQERLLQSASWLAVALPFWEFLHHTVIRALVHANEQERAERCWDQMEERLHNTQPQQPQTLPRRDRTTAVERIVAMEQQTEGKELMQLVQNDRSLHWLHWLSYQLKITPVGEANESILKLIMPALSMHAKRKTKQDAEQADELLQRLVQEVKAGNPRANITNSFFNCACDAWAKVGEPHRAQNILNDMGKVPGLEPDVISLSTVAAAWANSRDAQAAPRAEEILHRMEEQGMNPTTITYNTVLRSLIHSPADVGKAMRAEEIVRRMEERYEAGHGECRPSIRTYQSLISAWSRTDLSGTAQKAEQVLHFLDKKSQEEPGYSDLEPNAHCFGAAIHAWAYSQEEQKATRAYNILSHMRDLYEKQGKEHCKPSVVVYTSVINACANPFLEDEKEPSYQIAQTAMQELCDNQQRYGWPNFLTYAAFLQVCETTLQQRKRDEVVRTTFTKCCEAGQAGDIVIEKLRRAASKELYEELMIDTGIEQPNTGIYSLPRSWTRRVPSAQSRPKRPRKKKLYRPERARMNEVRILRGSAGRYSRGKDENASAFEEGSF